MAELDNTIDETGALARHRLAGPDSAPMVHGLNNIHDGYE